MCMRLWDGFHFGSNGLSVLTNLLTERCLIYDKYDNKQLKQRTSTTKTTQTYEQLLKHTTTNTTNCEQIRNMWKTTRKHTTNYEAIQTTANIMKTNENYAHVTLEALGWIPWGIQWLSMLTSLLTETRVIYEYTKNTRKYESNTSKTYKYTQILQNTNQILTKY